MVSNIIPAQVVHGDKNYVWRPGQSLLCRSCLCCQIHLRLLRLIKLARILRASRIFSRWEHHISISYGTQSLIKLFIGVLLMLHWLCELPRAAARERAEQGQEQSSEQHGGWASEAVERRAAPRSEPSTTARGCPRLTPAGGGWLGWLRLTPAAHG